jgi:hypothetical protein
MYCMIAAAGLLLSAAIEGFARSYLDSIMEG